MVKLTSLFARIDMQGIPEQIKLFNFAKKNLSFSQTYQVRDFPRVSDILSNVDDEINVELDFYLLENKIPCIKGSIELNAQLKCQRCLDDVAIELAPKFNLAFIANEQQAQELDSSLETVLFQEEELSTIEFLTDEVLISIPMIPMHEHACVDLETNQDFDEQKRENPFAILKELKTRH